MMTGKRMRPRIAARDLNRGHRDTKVTFFTIADVAESLRVATRTVRRWIEAGDLVAHRVGSVVRIAEGDLRAFLALHREG
jgi:excisionase family DNA binding protein